MGTGRHPPRGLPRGSLSPQPGDNRAPHRPQVGVHIGSRRSSVSTSSQGWRRLHRTGASTHCSREAEGHYIQHPGLLTSPNPLYARDMAQKGAQRHAWAELAGWQAGSRGLLQLDPYAAALCEGPAHVQSHPPQDQKPKARSRCLLERSALLAASPALSGTGPQGRVQVAPRGHPSALQGPAQNRGASLRGCSRHCTACWRQGAQSRALVLGCRTGTGLLPRTSPGPLPCMALRDLALHGLTPPLPRGQSTAFPALSSQPQPRGQAGLPTPLLSSQHWLPSFCLFIFWEKKVGFLPLRSLWLADADQNQGPPRGWAEEQQHAHGLPALRGPCPRPAAAPQGLRDDHCPAGVESKEHGGAWKKSTEQAAMRAGKDRAPSSCPWGSCAWPDRDEGHHAETGHSASHGHEARSRPESRAPQCTHTHTPSCTHASVYAHTHSHTHSPPHSNYTHVHTQLLPHTRACSLTYTLTPTFTITLTLTCTHTHGPGCGCARGAEGCRPHGPRGLRRLLAGAGHSPRRLRSGPHPLARSRSAHSPLPTRPGPSVSHSPASPREEDERGRGGCTAAGTPRAARRALLPRKQLARCSGPRGAEVRGIASPSISLQIYPKGNISQPGGVGDRGPKPRHRTPPRREGPGNEKLPELQQDCGRRQRGSAQARGPKLAGRRPQGRPRPRPGTCAHDTSRGRGTLQVRFSQGP